MEPRLNGLISARQNKEHGNNYARIGTTITNGVTCQKISNLKTGGFNFVNVAGGNLLPKNAVVIVAHPDDESLWCGAHIYRYSWPVLCCCVPEKDPERCGHFFDACNVLCVRGAIIHVSAIPEMVKGFDAVITHNELGEYGHKFHKEINHRVLSLGKQVFVFNYGIQKGEQLSDLELKMKRLAVNCYKSRPKAWDNQSQKFNLTRESLLAR